MHRILPSTGSGPPSPVLLRRRRSWARARRSPGWRWPDFSGAPSPPPRPARRPVTTAPRRDDSRRPLLRARDAHTTRGAAEAETGGGGGGGGRRTSRARSTPSPRCAASPAFRRDEGITETPLSVMALSLGCAVPVARAALLAFHDEERTKRTVYPSFAATLKSPESLAFDWCAFAAGLARAPRGDRPARDAAFLEDPTHSTRAALRARFAQWTCCAGERCPS